MVFFSAVFYAKFLLFCFATNVLADINFSTSNSNLNLKSGASINSSQNLSIQGKITMDAGSVISGGLLNFDSGEIARQDLSGVAVRGAFSIDAGASPVTEVDLSTTSVNFQDGAKIDLLSPVSLANTWTFFGNVVINGNGNSLKTTSGTAVLNFQSGCNVTFTDLTLQGIENTKFVIADNTVNLNFSKTNFELAADLAFANGNFIIKSESKFIVSDNDFVLSSNATLTVEGGTLWVDTLVFKPAPVFGFLDGAGKITTFINNNRIKRTSDYSHVVDPGTGSLTSGGSSGNVVIQANSEILPSEQILISSVDTVIDAGGNSMTFAAADEPQVVVEPGFTATFGSIEMLRINSKTFDLSDGATVRFKDNAVLEFVDDVTYDQGLFEIIGANSQVLLRGLGGQKKITFTRNSETGTNGGLALGVNTLVLEDIELDGLEYVSKLTKSAGDLQLDGKIILAGQSRVNVRQDSDMNFTVQGNNNKLLFHSSDLSFSGRIRFQDFYDSTLRIGFATNDESTSYILNLASNSVVMDAAESECTIQFDNDDVTLVNQSPYSFIIRGRSILAGNTIRINENPLVQEAEQFSFGSSVNLETDLPNPIEIVPIALTDENRSSFFYSSENSPFRSPLLRALNVPKPRLVIKNSLSGRNLKGNISIKPFGRITSFQPHETSPLNLILEGNATIFTQTRREGRVAQVIRQITTASNDEDNLDALKNGDQIFVSGTSNKIVVTGYLDIKGTINLDEESELIFEFDNSIDTEKAIRFSQEDGFFNLSMPKSSSLVFQGAGSVLFSDNSTIEFQGDAPEDLESVATGIFKDNRPSLIFKRDALLGIDEGKKLTLSGKGKLLLQEDGEIRILNGKLIVGTDVEDIFDLTVDTRSGVKIGSVGQAVYTPITRPARMSLSKGTFNIRFDRRSELAIRNGGIFEVGLLDAVYTQGATDSIKFDKDAKINLTNDGMLALSQLDITESENLAAQSLWNNTNGLVEGDGIIALFTNVSTDPVLQAQIQAKTFESTLISPFEVVKGLARITSDLIFASNYVDKTDGLTKVITPNDRIVTLDDGDEIRREGPITGNVYGTSAGGQRFAIYPDGTKEFFN